MRSSAIGTSGVALALGGEPSRAGVLAPVGGSRSTRSRSPRGSSRGRTWRLELARIAADRGARLHQGALAEFDAAAMIVPALEPADAAVPRGTNAVALKRFDADEDVAGPLPTARQAQPEESTQQRARAHR